MNAPNPPLPLIITKKEAAALIGVSERTIQRWIQAGKFPLPKRVTPTSRLRWARADIELFVACGLNITSYRTAKRR